MDHYSVQLFLQMLEEQGMDIQQLLQRSGLSLSQLQRQDAMLKLASAALALSDDKSLGLRFGTRLTVPQLGVFGYALMSSATAEDALKLLLQYKQLLMPEMTLALEQEEAWVSLSSHAKQLPPALERFTIECFFVAVKGCITELMGIATNNVVFRFDYAEPEYADAYQQLGGRVEFNSQQCQILFPSSLLKAPISSANPVTETIYRQQCDLLMQQLGSEEPISARVQELLLQRRGDFPDIGQIAKTLHMSDSTLRRRLKSEGTGYQKILDKVRYHLACQYLQSTQLPVAEVGRLTGFDDVANFRRAFGRWSGIAPSEFRASLAISD